VAPWSFYLVCFLLKHTWTDYCELGGLSSGIDIDLYGEGKVNKEKMEAVCTFL
jgi:hypothetical protein